MAQDHQTTIRKIGLELMLWRGGKGHTLTKIFSEQEVRAIKMFIIAGWARQGKGTCSQEADKGKLGEKGHCVQVLWTASTSLL